MSSQPQSDTNCNPHHEASPQLRLRSSNSSRSDTDRRPLMAPHRLSSQELVELEEQLLHHSAIVNDPPEDDDDHDAVEWNPNTLPSPSDEEDIDDDDDTDDDDDDDDDDQAQLSSMSDTDDSADSGAARNDVTCGVVEDALLQFTMPSESLPKYVDSNSTAEGKTQSLQRTASTYSLSTTITPKSERYENHPPDNYSPKMKTPPGHGTSGDNAATATAATHHHHKKRRFLLSRFHRKQKKDTVPAVFDFEQYMLKREMNVTQEKWNALTVLPNPMYCLYFVLSAQWLYYYSTSSSQGVDENAWEHVLHDDSDHSSHGCLTPSRWHTMPVFPPLPVLAVVVGICVHAPWSFLYHWTYAHTMSATQRTKHWSRRMDQSFIHVASSFMCYGTSGSLQYFLINTLYNLDCVRRQFRPTVRPKQNQMRIIISIIAYTLPLLKHGAYNTFLQLWVLFSISGYFFIHYPVGGWSHAVFHIVIAFVPPLLLRTATALPASQTQLYRAAWCAATTAHR